MLLFAWSVLNPVLSAFHCAECFRSAQSILRHRISPQTPFYPTEIDQLSTTSEKIERVFHAIDGIMISPEFFYLETIENGCQCECATAICFEPLAQ